MLLSYSVKNYKSFKDEAELSLIVEEDSDIKERYTDNFYKTNSEDIFRSAIIVGGNGGGKSNFLESLNYLRHFFNGVSKVITSINTINDYYVTPQEKIKKDMPGQSFSVELINNKKRYAYILDIDIFGIKNEELYTYNDSISEYDVIYKVNRKKIVKNKKLAKNEYINYNAQCNSKYIEENIIKSIEKSFHDMPNYGLNISRFAIMGQSDAINVIKWFREKIIVESPRFFSYDVARRNKITLEDIVIMKSQEFWNIFRLVDASIFSIIIDEKDPMTDTRVIRKDTDGKKHVHKIIFESSGIREYFAWSLLIYKAIYNDVVIFADEIDRVLNPVLSAKIFRYFNSIKHKGQIIFTTHNIMHMDFRVLMKGQINIVEKNNFDLTSEIYPLTRFEDLTYDDHRAYEYYLRGMLGGIGCE